MKSANTIAINISAEIEKQIIKGDYAPGQQIPNEQYLITEFEVSRSTVREAIKLLVSKGTLEIRRGKGTFVCQLPGMVEDPLGLNFINTDDLDGYLREARAIFEPQIAKLSAIRATEDEIGILKKLAEDIDDFDRWLEGEKTSEQLISQLHEKDLAFHIMLCRMCRNPVLERLMPIIIQSIKKSYQPESFKNRLTKGRDSTHKKICQAIADRNQELAYQLMITHLTNSTK